LDGVLIIGLFFVVLTLITPVGMDPFSVGGGWAPWSWEFKK